MFLNLSAKTAFRRAYREARRTYRTASSSKFVYAQISVWATADGATVTAVDYDGRTIDVHYRGRIEAAACRALQAREDAAFWQRHAAVQRAARLSDYIF